MSRQSHKSKPGASATSTDQGPAPAPAKKPSKFKLPEPEAPAESAVGQLAAFVGGFSLAPPVEHEDLRALHDAVRGKVRELGLDGKVEVEHLVNTGEVVCRVFFTESPDPEFERLIPIVVPGASADPSGGAPATTTAG